MQTLAVLIYVHLVANVSNRLKPRIKLVVGVVAVVILVFVWVRKRKR